jgi:hypothetical protein
MTEKIKKRLGDRAAKAVEYAGQHGVSAMMDEFGIKDYIAAINFLKEETNDPTFGIAPNHRPAINYKAPLTEYMGECAAVARLIEMDARIKASVARKKRRLAELEQKIFDAEEQLYSNRDWEPVDLNI